MKKVLIIVSSIIVLLLIAVIYVITTFGHPFTKLNSGKLTSEFVTDTIPFTYSCSGHILIDVKINDDKTYPFILDSGASNLVFSHFSKGMNFNNNGYSPSINAAQSWSLDPIKKIKKIQFGAIEFENIKAKEIDFDFECQEDICGIIGTGVMHHFTWQIDFDKQQIIVAQNANDLKFTPNRIEIPLQENKLSHHLNVNLQFGKNKPSKNVLIDLGNNSTLSLSERSILKDSVEYEFKNISGQATRSLGEMDTLITHKYYRADSLLFENSDYAITNVTVRAATKSLNLLGLGFFNKYRTTINWPKRKLILEPTDTNPDFIGKTSGFSLDYNKEQNKAEVTVITENTPAWGAHLEMNTEVISINDMPLTDYELYCKYLHTKFTSDTVDIKLKEGTSTRIMQLVKQPVFP